MENPFEVLQAQMARLESQNQQIIQILSEKGITIHGKAEQPISIERVSELLRLSRGGIYQNPVIPRYKRNNKLYFFESEILNYIKNGPKYQSESTPFERRSRRNRR